MIGSAAEFFSNPFDLSLTGLTNVFLGGEGEDTIYSGIGNDTMYAGGGDDRYIVHAGEGDDIVRSAGSGNDVLEIRSTEILGFSADHSNVLAELSETGNDLKFSFMVNGKSYGSVTVEGIGSGDNDVETLVLADGATSQSFDLDSIFDTLERGDTWGYDGSVTGKATMDDMNKLLETAMKQSTANDVGAEVRADMSFVNTYTNFSNEELATDVVAAGAEKQA